MLYLFYVNVKLSMNLKTIRSQIDTLDEKLLKILAKREELVVQIAAVKQAKGLPVHDAQREKKLLTAKKKLAKQLGLAPTEIEKIFKLILTSSRKSQRGCRSARGVSK